MIFQDNHGVEGKDSIPAKCLIIYNLMQDVAGEVLGWNSPTPSLAEPARRHSGDGDYEVNLVHGANNATSHQENDTPKFEVTTYLSLA